jgi:hypothetical protein
MYRISERTLLVLFVVALVTGTFIFLPFYEWLTAAWAQKTVLIFSGFCIAFFFATLALLGFCVLAARHDSRKSKEEKNYYHREDR